MVVTFIKRKQNKNEILGLNLLFKLKFQLLLFLITNHYEIGMHCTIENSGNYAET